MGVLTKREQLRPYRDICWWAKLISMNYYQKIVITDTVLVYEWHRKQDTQNTWLFFNHFLPNIQLYMYVKSHCVLSGVPEHWCIQCAIFSVSIEIKFTRFFSHNKFPMFGIDHSLGQNYSSKSLIAWITWNRLAI